MRQLPAGRSLERRRMGTDVKIACQDGRVVDVMNATDLASADVRGLNLHRAVLERQAMAGLMADGVDFRGAVLSLAIADGASLTGAILANARCEGISLRGASLENSVLSGAHFIGADLTDANLSGAHALNADFTGANLDGANLRCDDLTGAVWTGALISTRTVLPQGFDPSGAGMVLVGDQMAIFYQDGEPTPGLFP
jgi:uncharacterized protein YjbI with pentapeptide repeats